MNLYVISQDVVGGYDTYDSAVVAAESEAEARMIHPSVYERDWDGSADKWGAWCDAKDVKVELIGVAVEGTERGVIVSSFNAG